MKKHYKRYFFLIFCGLKILGSLPCLAASALHEDDAASSIATVRIWYDELHEGKHVGHISLDTGQQYISLWPGREDRLEGTPGTSGIIGAVVKRFSDTKKGCITARASGNSLMMDLYMEHRAPEQIYQLKLNGAKINQVWETLCSRSSQLKCPLAVKFGLPDYQAVTVNFQDLTWYVGGDPASHKLDGLAEDLVRVLEREQHYNCATLVLQMLIRGDIYQQCDIQEQTLLDMIPACEQDWYRNILEEAEAREERFSAFGLVGRVMLEPEIKPNYVTPYYVGEFLKLCCCKQYSQKLFRQPVSRKDEIIAMCILKSHNPKKKMVQKYDRHIQGELQKAELEADFRSAINEYYINAAGRTIDAIETMITLEIASTDKGKGSCLLM